MPRILIVDDEPQVTSAMKLLLRKAPFELITTNDPREAVDLASNGNFDVVVTDMQMPEVDGVSVLAQIREKAPQTVRIVLSGHASLERTIAAINGAGVFRFLTKPCSRDELLASIQEALIARESNREPQADGELCAAFESATRSLWMAAQPIVSVREHKVIAYEALVRSREPRLPHGGAIMEAAEQLGQIKRIERQIRGVLGDVARDLPSGQLLLVNLHPDTLDDPDLVSTTSPLAPYAASVVFEITERARLKADGPGWRALQTLRSRGHRIALDDLGAGYAGLNSLFSLKPDIVKIDMELVRDVHKSPPRAKFDRIDRRRVRTARNARHRGGRGVTRGDGMSCRARVRLASGILFRAARAAVRGCRVADLIAMPTMCAPVGSNIEEPARRRERIR